jgi:hypothetical protein
LIKGEKVDVEIARTNDAKRKFAVEGKYPEGFDINRIKYLEAAKNWNKFNNVGDYRAYAIQAATNEKTALADAAKNMFWRKAESGSVGWKDPRESMPGGWNQALISNIRKTVPGFNPQNSYDMSTLISTYNSIDQKVIRTQELSSTEDKLYKTLSPLKSKMKAAQDAMNSVDAVAYINNATARARSIEAAGDRMGIKMSDKFRSGLTDVLTGKMSDEQALAFSKQNATTLAGIGGTTSSYFTSGLNSAESVAGKIMGAPAITLALENAEKKRQRTVISALQKAAVSDKSNFMDAVKGIDLKLNETDKAAFKIESVEDASRKLQVMMDKYRMDESASVVSGDQGKSRYVNVTPPITNYWNNRWVM